MSTLPSHPPVSCPSTGAPPCTLFLLLTCPEEEDVMLPILSLHPVHHELVQAVGQVGLHQQGPAVPGVHGLVHEGVCTGKVQHLVRKVLGGAELPPGLVGCLAGALWGPEVISSAWPPQHPPSPSTTPQSCFGSFPAFPFGIHLLHPFPRPRSPAIPCGFHREPIPAGEKMEDQPHHPPRRAIRGAKGTWWPGGLLTTPGRG